VERKAREERGPQGSPRRATNFKPGCARNLRAAGLSQRKAAREVSSSRALAHHFRTGRVRQAGGFGRAALADADRGSNVWRAASDRVTESINQLSHGIYHPSSSLYDPAY